jgi:amidohydrolase
MISNKKIKSLANHYFSKVTEIRRHLHQNPELSFKEYETSKYIQEQLTLSKIKFKTGYVETGIVAIIEGKNPHKKTILLRADMDALPIDEKNNVDYKSKKQGIMHACGHDAHSAIALGSAFILNDLKNDFEGTIKIMFQPGEELLPGGANLMIEAGVLDNPKVDKALALHVFPSMEVGKVGFKSGMYMASSDELYISVIGKGGHAAMPNECINPLIIASEIILEINKLFMQPNSLKGTPGENIPTVVVFGKIDGKGATNVIPSVIEIAGTIRTMDESWRESIHQQIKLLVKNVSLSFGIESIVRIEKGYPFLVNDITFTNNCFEAAINYLGENQVEVLPLRMTAEDFSFISQKVPSCFFRLGTGNKSKGIISGVHTSNFDIDEKSLEIGIGLMAWLALNELNS